MSEENKAVARRFFEIWNSGELEQLDEVIAADAVDHDTQNPFASTTGPDGARQLMSTYRDAFPDLRFTVEDQLAEGDRVTTRWTATGTHEGDMMGVAPTGKQSTVTGMTIDRIEDGKVAEGWTNWDTMGMMQQLELIPEAQTAS